MLVGCISEYNNMKKIVSIFILLFTVLFSLGATTYYVSPTGSSGNSGLSTSVPWPLQYAMNTVANGDTIMLMDGVYTAASEFSIYSRNNVTIKAINKWKAIIANNGNFGIYCDSSGATRTDHMIVDGLCVSNTILTAGVAICNYSTVRNCWIVGNNKDGISASGPNSSNNIIEYNLIEDNDKFNDSLHHGMYISGSGNIVRGNVVRNNHAGFGIQLYTEDVGHYETNNLVYNNLTYGHTTVAGLVIYNANGIYTTLTGTNYVFNNTILDGFYTSWGTVMVSNNIILPNVNTPNQGIYPGTSRPPTIYADYNASSAVLTNIGGHDIITNNIGFVNSANGLYWLKSDSAVRGKAKTTVFSSPDFFGNTISSVTDIGAFQYNSLYASDTRTLDPSGTTGADYWTILTSPGGGGNGRMLTIRTLRVGH